MRLKPTKTTIYILGGGVALMLLLFGGVVYWQQSVLTSARATLGRKEVEVTEGRKIAKRREQARLDLEADQAKLQFLETAVSDAAFVPTLLKQLEELAINTNNRVIGVRPQVVQEAPTRLQQRRDPEAQANGDKQEGDKKEETKAPEPYTRLGIQVNMVGSYRTVQAFTDHLTRFPKILAVEEMQLRPHRAEGGVQRDESAALLDVDLRLTAFIMKEPTTAKPTTTAIAASGGIN